MLADKGTETWTYSVLAGERAKAKFANVDAAEFLRRALSAAPALPSLSRAEVGRTWESLGDLLMLSADYADAHEAYRHARKLVRGDANGVAGLCLKEGLVREAEGHYSDALRWFTRGLRTSRRSTMPRSRRTGFASRSAMPASAFVRERSPTACNGANAPSRRRAVPVRWRSSRTPITSCISRTPRSAARSARASATSRCRSTRSSAIFSGRRTRSTTSASTRTTRAAGTTRSTTTSGAGAHASGSATSSAPRRSRTTLPRRSPTRASTTRRRRCSSRWTRRARAAGSLLMTAVVDGNLGRLAARKGQHDEARRLLTTALAAFREIDAAAFVLEMQARLAEAAVLAGDHDQALRDAEVAELTSEVAPPPPLQAMLHRMRGYAHLQAGRHEDAARNFAHSLDARARAVTRCTRSRSRCARGRVSRVTPMTPPRRSGSSTRCTSCTCRTSRSKREPSRRRARPRRSRLSTSPRSSPSTCSGIGRSHTISIRSASCA